MISCTEFIPCYSELFTYLDDNYGKEEVKTFWDFLFEPDGKGISLINFLKKEGIHGCWSYWSGALNEEAADFTIMLNEKKGWYQEMIHHCPSKGRLLELEKEIGLKPYPDYCKHCAGYRSALEKVSLKQINFRDEVDKAKCSGLIYDPKIFKGDGDIEVDEDTLIMGRKASDNEYFHRAFHSGMNMGIEDICRKFGRGAVKNFLTQYTEHVYCKVIEEISSEGLDAIERIIRDTYQKEHVEDALSLQRTEKSLIVTVRYCPAVKHLHETGRVVSSWYCYTTEDVMETLALKGGYSFCMESYDEATGAAVYYFEK